MTPPTTTTICWLDTNDCPRAFHEFSDSNCVHGGDAECPDSEFGGAAWIDVGDCDRSYHEIIRDSNGQARVVHADGGECAETEFEVSNNG